MSGEDKQLEAQKVLDALLGEGLLPFKLTVGSLLDQGSSQYSGHFYDSRIRSVQFSWQENESFSEVFRAAVLARGKNERAFAQEVIPLMNGSHRA